MRLTHISFDLERKRRLRLQDIRPGGARRERVQMQCRWEKRESKTISAWWLPINHFVEVQQNVHKVLVYVCGGLLFRYRRCWGAK